MSHDDDDMPDAQGRAQTPTWRDVGVEGQIDARWQQISEFLRVNLNQDNIHVVFYDEHPTPTPQRYQAAFTHPQQVFFFTEGEEIIDLEACWRCGDEVPRDDDLGLCKPCVQALQDL